MPYYEQDTFAATTVDGVQLHTNDGLLAPSDVAPLRASYPTEPLKELYDRYLTDGYVFLKGLLPRQDVLDAREAYFKSLEPTGILEPGTTPVEGRFNSSADMADYPGIGAAALDVQPGSNNKAAIFVEAAIKAHTEPWYCGSEKEGIIGLCNHPAIREVVAKMTGWGHDTLTVRRTLLRNNTPGNKAIGVHYDQTFMRYGEPTAVTAWIPIGDISVEGGGLIYLKGGDKIGQRIEEDFTLKAKEAGMGDQEMRSAFNANMMKSGFLSESPREFSRAHGTKWLVTAYKAGDVVLHCSHMIHASTVNHDPQGRIRLGTDLRYVNGSRPWDKRWDKDFELSDGL